MFKLAYTHLRQMVYLIDLPHLLPGQQVTETTFFTELKRFLTAAGIDDSIIRSLDKYDFAQTALQGFIHSMYVRQMPLQDPECAAELTRLQRWLTQWRRFSIHRLQYLKSCCDKPRLRMLTSVQVLAVSIAQ